MSRRSHRKTRQGLKCEECKRRHIRCDQQRPECLNCTRAERACVYMEPEAGFGTQLSVPQPRPTGTSSPQMETSSASVSSSNASSLQSGGDLVNLTHLELYDNIGVLLGFFTGPDPEIHASAFATYRKEAFAKPYLMHQLLATSAMHLSVVGPAEKSQFFSEQAMILQTHALTLVNNMSPAEKQNNSTAMLIFSNWLGVQFLCHTLRNWGSELRPALDRLAEYFRIHHGVRPLHEDYLAAASSSTLRWSISWGYTLATAQGRGSECQALRERMGCMNDLSPASVFAYNKSINLLQVIHDRYPAQKGFPGSISWLSIWLVGLPAEFIQLIQEQKPLALATLAYYGAFLHLHFKDVWVVGDAGRKIVQTIATRLGDEWATCLAGANEIVQHP